MQAQKADTHPVVAYDTFRSRRWEEAHGGRLVPLTWSPSASCTGCLDHPPTPRQKEYNCGQMVTCVEFKVKI